MKFKKRYALIPIASIAGLLLFGWLFLQFINLRTYQLFGEIIPRIETTQKVVALTFDDGPTPYTNQILLILKEKDIKATFFMIGKDIEAYPEIAKNVVAEGHQIANHSYSHKRNVFKSSEFYKNEVDATSRAIRAVGYNGEIMFRPPYGKKFIGLPHYLSQIGMKTITWDVEPDTYGDWEDEGNTKFLVDYTLDHVKPGSIIILHPFCEECVDERAAVPSIIDKLKAQGYTFVTVEELLKYQNK